MLMVASDELPGLEALAERHYAAGDFTRKGPSYLRSYARLLDPRRLDNLAILELGVSSGASLLCWRDYLPKATIVGIDIAEPPARILGLDRLHFIQGSQDDPKVLERAAKIVGGAFDIIVDDASHIGYLTKRSLHYLFPRGLKPVAGTSLRTSARDSFRNIRMERRSLRRSGRMRCSASGSSTAVRTAWSA